MATAAEYRVLRSREDCEERIAFGVDLHPRPRGERVPNDLPMPLQDTRIRIAQGLQQARGALYVG